MEANVKLSQRKQNKCLCGRRCVTHREWVLLYVFCCRLQLGSNWPPALMHIKNLNCCRTYKSHLKGFIPYFLFKDVLLQFWCNDCYKSKRLILRRSVGSADWIPRAVSLSTSYSFPFMCGKWWFNQVRCSTLTLSLSLSLYFLPAIEE